MGDPGASGRLLAAGAEKRMLAAQQETEAFIASSFGTLDGDDDPGPPNGGPEVEASAVAGPPQPAA